MAARDGRAGVHLYRPSRRRNDSLVGEKGSDRDGLIGTAAINDDNFQFLSETSHSPEEVADQRLFVQNRNDNGNQRQGGN